MVVLLSVFIISCTSKPVLNLDQILVPGTVNGAKQSLKSVQEAIFSGAKRRGWSPRLVQQGIVEASISVRSHSATVEIMFNDDSYSIKYKNSTNLNYNNTTIHRNYNNWVLKLSRTIQQELGVNSQKY